MSEPVFLTLDEVLELHEDQISTYGGDPGDRDMGLIEAAVAMPAASYAERSLVPGLGLTKSNAVSVQEVQPRARLAGTCGSYGERRAPGKILHLEAST